MTRAKNAKLEEESNKLKAENEVLKNSLKDKDSFINKNTLEYENNKVQIKLFRKETSDVKKN